jgi:hypothetical protein
VILDARDALREGVAIARDHSAAKQNIPWILALLAEAHLALGEPTEAVATAREGIELACAGGCHYYEAQAQLTLAAGLLATDGVVPRAEIESALARAEQTSTARSVPPATPSASGGNLGHELYLAWAGGPGDRHLLADSVVICHDK